MKILNDIKEIQKIISLTDDGKALKSAIRFWVLQNDGIIDPTLETLYFIIDLWKKNGVGKPRDLSYFHASESARGLRRQVLTVLGHKPERDLKVGLEFIFDDGKWRHLKWQCVFKMMGILVDAEHPVRHKKWNYGGTADAIVKLDDEKYVIEIKGANTYKFAHIRKTNKPIIDHLWQIIGYMYVMNIPKGIIFYENKNDQDLEEFLIELKDYQHIIYDMNQQYRKAGIYLQKGKLPGFCCTLRSNDRDHMNCSQRKNCLSQAKLGNFPKNEINKRLWEMKNVSNKYIPLKRKGK